jgi:hypothetical protein
VHDGGVYRTRSQAIGLGCFLLVELAVAVDGTVRGRSVSAIGDVFGGVVLLVTVTLTARAAMAALIVTNRGVTVRNPLRTVSIAVDEIAAFQLGRYKILGCVCLIRRVDGSVVPVFAVQGITGQPRRRTSVLAKETVDRLNEWLDQHDSAAGRTQAARALSDPAD